MSLPHALLTALIERPGSGLELAARFDKSIGHFWSATHQQIYRELARMEQDGLIASEPEADSRGRKRSYRVLPEGRAELIRWLGVDEDTPRLRDPLMVRLRAEAVVGPSDLAAPLLQRLQGHRDKLAQYRRIEAEDFSTASRSKAEALRRLILSAGIRHEANWIEVLTEALDLLGEAE